LKSYIKFLKGNLLGKLINFFARILFGKLAFVTGYGPDGREFLKTTTTRRLDSLFRSLKEGGYSQLDEHSALESAESSLKSLAVERRRI
jgi:hypothetical protein